MVVPNLLKKMEASQLFMFSYLKAEKKKRKLHI